MQKTDAHKQSLKLEIIRFVIVGVICTILDLGVNLLFMAVLPESIGMWRSAIAITFGFIVGVISNYLFSTFWVFQNVKDKKKAKTALSIFIFVLLSAIGLGINYAIFYSCWGIILNWNINIDITFKEMNFSSIAFWLWGVVFCLKTLIVLVYNYLTRKFIIYKAPKKENPNE